MCSSRPEPTFFNLPDVPTREIVRYLPLEDRRSLSKVHRKYSFLKYTQDKSLSSLPLFDVLLIDSMTAFALLTSCPYGSRDVWSCRWRECSYLCTHSVTHKKRYSFGTHDRLIKFVEAQGRNAHFKIVNILADRRKIDQQLECYSNLWKQFDLTFVVDDDLIWTRQILSTFLHSPQISAVYAASAVSSNRETMGPILEKILNELVESSGLTNVSVGTHRILRDWPMYNFPIIKTIEDGQTNIVVEFQGKGRR